MRIETIFLEVGDAATVDTCRDWYTKHFGLAVLSEEPGESVWLDAGNGLRFGFHTGDANQSASAVNLSFEVGDADAEAARLQSEGITLVAEPWDAPWGARVATMVDPAGHGVWISGPLKS